MRSRERHGVSNRREFDYSFNMLFRLAPRKTWTLCFTGFCEENRYWYTIWLARAEVMLKAKITIFCRWLPGWWFWRWWLFFKATKQFLRKQWCQVIQHTRRAYRDEFQSSLFMFATNLPLRIFAKIYYRRERLIDVAKNTLLKQALWVIQFKAFVWHYSDLWESTGKRSLFKRQTRWPKPIQGNKEMYQTILCNV